MVFFRYCMITALLLCIPNAHAQTVYYPASASSLLQSTANDIAALFQKAIQGSHFSTHIYSSMPTSGITLVYDTSVAGNQACRVKGDGNGNIQFSASEDNGLLFGVYQYIRQLGFRFYQPGSIWEIIPTLNSVYKKIDTIYTCRYKYKTWFISGGHNNWAMDKVNAWPWDTYFGDNGHEWALYQRRNNMLGAYRFAGHRDDVMTESYMVSLQNNPCYVAPYNGSRKATSQSVPDINSAGAMQLWAGSIEKKYTQFKNNIFSNKNIYPNFYHNFTYNHGHIGIEVPDGAHWGNSKDNSDCGNNILPAESDQHFTLANFVTDEISKVYPGKIFQLYAYDGHADIPSLSVPLKNNIDVQVVPTAFQSVSSPKSLLSRWYGRSANVSEYHYLNIGQWSGETPSFFLNDFKNTLQRLKEKNSQGIVIEASPAKFASLPFLLAFNNNLKENAAVEETLQEFCSKMFGAASATIYQLLQLWGDDKTVMLYNGLQDNKYKMPLYFNLLQKANNEIKKDSLLVKERMNELKIYLHYMLLHYDWAFDQQPVELKESKAAALCIYLAKINKLKIVNSYFLISNIVARYPPDGSFFSKYNVINGSAYQSGSLPLITQAETEADFKRDLISQNALVQEYNFETAKEVKEAFSDGNLLPLEKIKVFINYTHGKDYATKSEFYINAKKSGEFSVRYKPYFNMQNKGYINFTVEATDKPLGIIKDFSINEKNGGGLLTVELPVSGTYKLTVVAKYQSALALEINTNGNYFYKNGPYLGNTIENYRGDLQSLPGYFHVPAGVSKVYFSLNNSNPGGKGFATAAEISKIFAFRDNHNKSVEPKLVTASDSALFYLDVPEGSSGSFWQSYKMEQYQLTFANISNIQWYASRKSCELADFTMSVIQGVNGCTTQLKASSYCIDPKWKLESGANITFYNNQEVTLPDDISPNTLITLTSSNTCTVAKRPGDNAAYLEQKRNCASGGSFQQVSLKASVYPNPGTGIYNCQYNGQPVIPEEIIIFNSAGIKAAHFANTARFNIGHLQPGIYFYELMIKNTPFNGRLVKL
jgi:hypothetical protein